MVKTEVMDRVSQVFSDAWSIASMRRQVGGGDQGGTWEAAVTAFSFLPQSARDNGKLNMAWWPGSLAAGIIGTCRYQGIRHE